jgi:hypothetical protein
MRLSKGHSLITTMPRMRQKSHIGIICWPKIILAGKMETEDTVTYERRRKSGV